ncbi:MAG: tyrosine-type recombinase/integrase [Bacteroidales bacterium]|nr:tyrosine-type recombinase/integrase [Bacteroidales bacterium]
MSTIRLVLDTRRKLKDNKFNLSIRVCHKGSVQYLPIPNARFTETQYNQVFVRELKDEQSINWRELANKFKTKCDRVYSEMSVYNPKRFRELVYSKDKELPKTLLLKDLFDYYIENYEGITLKTRHHFRLSINKLESFQTGLTVQDITSEFLRHFDLEQQKAGLSRSTIDGIFRNLRRVINYFMLEKKLIPRTFEYPFGRGGYSIKSFFGRKLVMRNDEIQKVVDFKDFKDDKEMEYARDIWLFLYRANGINFADLLRMRWDSMQGGYLIFFRRKTQSTRKNNIKPITVPITDKLRELIDKVGVKDSPFILGLLEEGFAENTYENLSHKIRSNINEKLLEISKKLNLSVPLKLKTARDCYATTLKRAGVSKDNIGEMLGHSNSIVTEHYLASLDIEKTYDINRHIL